MALPDLSRFYIDGAWVEPVAARPFPLIDPATETAFGTLALGNAEDVDRAVRAARDAFPAYSETDRKSTRLNSSHSGESRMPSSA